MAPGRGEEGHYELEPDHQILLEPPGTGTLPLLASLPSVPASSSHSPAVPMGRGGFWDNQGTAQRDLVPFGLVPVIPKPAQPRPQGEAACLLMGFPPHPCLPWMRLVGPLFPPHGLEWVPRPFPTRPQNQGLSFDIFEPLLF